MKVISISTDRKLFEEGSSVRSRTIDQASLFEELHIIVYSKKRDNLEPWRIADNVWIYPTNSWTKFFYARDAVKQYKNILKNRKFSQEDTVITCQDPYDTGMAGTMIKKLSGFHLQLQIHTDFLSPYFRKESFLNKVRVRNSKKILPQADEIRVVSKRIKDSLKSLSIPEEKIDVLPIYTEIEKYQKPPTLDLYTIYPEFKFIILMASRLTHEKNIGMALHSIKEVIKKYPRLGLLIVGEGPESNNLKSLVQELNLENNVRFESWQKDLSSYYKTCNIFLLTSLYEGFGLTLLEAGLSGAAIITTDVGIAGDILKDGHNSFVCPVQDVHCLTGKILTLIENNSTRQIFKTGVVEDMTHAIIARKDEYLKMYKNCLERALHNIHETSYLHSSN